MRSRAAAAAAAAVTAAAGAAARWRPLLPAAAAQQRAFAAASAAAAAASSSAAAPKTPGQPLSIFVCAADAASDQAAAALVAALKRVSRQPLRLYGVGGSLLRAQGLQSVVTQKQFELLAAGEVVQQAGPGLRKLEGVGSLSRAAYLAVFKESIWDAAVDGCRGGATSSSASSSDGSGGGSSSRAVPEQLQQQQQQQAGEQQPAREQAFRLPPGVVYDAILSVGSPAASQQVLFVLHKAQEQKKARLPVVVQYLVPGLWDARQLSAARAYWARHVDHVMCGLPFEPRLLHDAGCPASFVGHPAVESLLQAGGFGSKAAIVAQLLQQRGAAAAGAGSSGGVERAAGGGAGRAATAGQLFTAGDAGAFWRMSNSWHSTQHAGGGAAATAQPSNNSSSSSSSRKRGGSSSRDAPAAAASAPGGTQQGRQLLVLLPGSIEAEVRSSMAAFDVLTRELLARFPRLAVAMLLPEVLVEAAINATNNFALPVVVLPAGGALATHALAAASAAVSHPGPASLAAAAAGVPLVCVDAGSLLSSGLHAWRHRQRLPSGCVPNLVLGGAAVPEVVLWRAGGRQAALEAVAQLLGEQRQQAAQAQRAALQDLLLALLPPQAAAAGGSSLQAPSKAAARTLLELVALRQEQLLARQQQGAGGRLGAA